MKIERTYFISHPDDCMIVHMKASGGQLSFVAKLDRDKYFDSVGKCDDHTIFLSGNLGKDAPEFAMCLRAKVVGGSVKTIGQSLLVEKADEVILYFPLLRGRSERMGRSTAKIGGKVNCSFGSGNGKRL